MIRWQQFFSVCSPHKPIVGSIAHEPCGLLLWGLSSFLTFRGWIGHHSLSWKRPTRVFFENVHGWNDFHFLGQTVPLRSAFSFCLGLTHTIKLWGFQKRAGVMSLLYTFLRVMQKHKHVVSTTFLVCQVVGPNFETLHIHCSVLRNLELLKLYHSLLLLVIKMNECECPRRAQMA